MSLGPRACEVRDFADQMPKTPHFRLLSNESFATMITF